MRRRNGVTMKGGKGNDRLPINPRGDEPNEPQDLHRLTNTCVSLLRFKNLFAGTSLSITISFYM